MLEVEEVNVKSAGVKAMNKVERNASALVKKWWWW